MDIAGIDTAHADPAVLASQFAGGTGEEKPERVAPHVRRFYRKMMGMLDERGLAGSSQAAKSLGALALKEQGAPAKPERFGKRDRQALKKKLVEEGKLVLHKTRRTKGTPAVIDPRAVDKLIADLPEEAKATPEAITATIGRLFGYRDQDALMRASVRAHRFMRNKGDRRMPSHVRSALVMSTAIMVATVALFPDQAEEGAIEAAKALREQFGAEVEG